MRGAVLFLRTRRWLVAVLVAVAAAALIVVCGPVNYSLNPRGGYLVAVASQVPVIIAITIQASIATPLRASERRASRPLTPWRLAHILSLTLIASTLVGLAATQIQPPAGALLHGYAPLGASALIRNLFAFMGTALIGAAAFGPRFGWVLPLAWAILPFVALPSPKADPSGLLMLAAQPDDAFAPFVVALITWAIGVALSAKDIGVDRFAQAPASV